MAEKTKKKQVMRYNDSELSLIKNAFAENDSLLISMRKVFLQMILSESDKDFIKASFKDKPNNLAVVRKTFLPTLDPEAPKNQLVDLFMTLELKEKTHEEAFPHLVARTKLVNLLEQQLQVLEAIANDVEIDTDINFADFANIEGKDSITAFSDILCRNTMIGHVEQQITQLALLAGMKTETVEQTQSRLQQDSSK